MRHYLKAGVVYALIGMASGVFYREFTKFSAFAGTTRLSLMHGHYLSLGLFFFLFLLILEKQFSWSSWPKAKAFVLVYHVGLNMSALGLFARGLSQVLGLELGKALDASISGLSGIGHLLLGVSLIAILLRVGKAIGRADS